MVGETKKESVIRETDEDARRLTKSLMRTARFGALAALEPGTGHPLSSRVAVTTDMDGTPVTLTSTLSGHTSAILNDSRCSLMVGEPGKGDPLAHPRVTLFTRAVRIDRDDPAHQRIKRRYLARHPKAKLYVDFGDFSFFRLEVERASLNGGFGKAFLLEHADMILDDQCCEALKDWEEGAVSHMNEDHVDAILLYATVLARQPEAKWALAALDPEGLDLVAGDLTARIWFETPLEAPEKLRAVLVDLAKQARSVQG